ncbi:MAG: LacI family DNA-binding transcriptional regulator [Betaproteobacteria bacterium]|nr:LacI family DNA-binding transcriptional regulator [Betaproteobacteria bacterium]
MARDKPSLLSDVARMAGVSLATASRTLSEPEIVHPETRQRVHDAVAKLGYVPHGAARALATKRSRTVGVVIPTLDNPIFASSVQAMQQRLAQDGYTLLLGGHEYDLAAEAGVVLALVERGVDGIVLVGTDHDASVYRMLDKERIPYELTWTLDERGHHYCLGFSNRAAAAQVALHVIDLGHRRIAMISGHTESNDRARERVAGVRDTLRAHGLALPNTLLVETEFSIHRGREALRAVLAAEPRITAVVCGNDILALGVLIEAAARGIAVPKALSVTGFDDIDLAHEWSPGLTTVRLPVSEIGRRAAERMLARIAGKDVARTEEVQVEFIARGSTGPSPGRRSL